MTDKGVVAGKGLKAYLRMKITDYYTQKRDAQT